MFPGSYVPRYVCDRGTKRVLCLLRFPPSLPNSGRENYHCMSLPFVEEGETSENPTQSIHNIVMTTEEAVNEVLNRQRFIR